jgi:hypothetical protein
LTKQEALQMKKYPIIAALALALCASAAVWFFARRKPPGASPASDSSPKAFEGSSDDLKETLIVSTLDEPMPPGKNVIWCASFQMAWNKLKDDVFKGSVALPGAQEAVDRLNNAPAIEGDLPEGAWYAAAGLTENGIIDKISKEMKGKFNVTPDLDTERSIAAVVAYAYLHADVPFTIPFNENPEEFVFNQNSATRTKVKSFGISEKDRDTYFDLRKQVHVLYMKQKYGNNSGPPEEFIIDPCRSSSPCQIILACIKPSKTLAETLKDAEIKIANWPARDQDHPFYREFNPSDILLVPEIRFLTNHHFHELEKGPVYKAMQSIQFKMDRGGAGLTSVATAGALCGPKHFIFDKPFLIIMKKRGSTRPFFVMWVSNAELLCKQER